MILVDEEEKRQLSVPCDNNMMMQLSIRLAGVVKTGELLPEAMLRLVRMRADDSDMELFVHNLVDGRYMVLLSDNKYMMSARIRMSDAVLLSLISEIPLYMSEELFEMQSTGYVEGGRNMSVPINALTNEMLGKALDNAVSAENYEMACRLRDEIAHRAGEKRHEDGDGK